MTTSYTVTKDDLILIKQKPSELGAEDKKRVGILVDDALCHALSVPSELCFEDLFKHTPDGWVAQEVAMWVSRVSSNLQMLKLKEDRDSSTTTTLNLEDGGLAAAHVSAQMTAYDAFANTIVPVLDIIHTHTIEMDSSRTVPIMELNRIAQTLEGALAVHAGNCKELMKQIKGLIELSTGTEMDNLGKYLGKTSLSKDTSMSGLIGMNRRDSRSSSISELSNTTERIITERQTPEPRKIIKRVSAFDRIL
jgi:hypothetical protein